MNAKSLLVCLFTLLFSYSYGQTNILNAKSPEEIGEKSSEKEKADGTEHPMPYPHTDDRDIMWGKNVWEYIDLNQRANFPLLYPTDKRSTGDDKSSLYHVLIENIENGNIKHLYTNSYFNRERSIDELDATLHYADTLEQGFEQLNAGEELDEQYVSHTDVDADDVQGYRIRGYWYFDKRHGDLRYRILGLAPMVIDAYSKQQDTEDPEPVALFWVFYPEVRDILYKATAFNPNNSSRPLNFDELLNSRKFDAVIYKTENEHGDREIRDYAGESAMKQLLESERVKEEIRDFEQNMWNY